MNVQRLAAVVVLVLAAHSRAGAQDAVGRTPKLAGQGTIVGVVTDTADNLVDSVQVYINSLQKRTISAANGTFRFDDIKPGMYDVGARRLGFLPQVRHVMVGREGGAVQFDLVPIIRTLTPVVTSSTRGGLSGVVGDTAYNIVEGAEIWVVSSDHRALSDSMGRFFIDVHPGNYMVRVSREGYTPRLLSVTVPEDSGRRVVAWLAPTRRGANNLELFNLQELSTRLATRVSARSKLYTREDITRVGYEDLLQMANAGAGRRVDESCPAIIDGGPQQIPIWGLSAADLESVEVYVAKPARATYTSIVGSRRAPRQVPPEQDCPVTVYAWLRK